MRAHPHSDCDNLYYIQNKGVWYAVSESVRGVWHYWPSTDKRDEHGRPEWAMDEQKEIDFSWEKAEELMGIFGLREAK